MLEEKVQAIGLVDYSSDFHAIPDSLFEKVLASDPGVPLETFDKPMSLKVAFDTDKAITFAASSFTNITVTLILPGFNAPVRIRGVKFIVTDQDMDVVLSGRPLLKSIGLDLHKHLVAVRETIHNKDISDLTDFVGILALLSYNVLAY